MIKKNSGKIYRFKLDHNLGFGFAEVYDFTDLSMFDGRIIYVYNRVDQDIEGEYSMAEIMKTGLALGPIRLYKFPNTRGIGSWKYLFQNDNLLIDELPERKVLHGLEWKDNNWSNLQTWYSSNYDPKGALLPTYINYEKLRHLETNVINSPSGVVRKFTMKIILDKKEKVSEFYDLLDLGNKNMFVQMINTYYPLEQTKRFLKQLPDSEKQVE